MASFATALMSMKHGHKVKRKHWIGYWELKDNNIIMHCYDGRVLNIRDSENIVYTIENMICDDWEIADKDHAEHELERQL